jgi:Tol biopolymer transport system component
MGRTPPKGGFDSQKNPVAGERLDSWKEIAGYLNRDVRTVQRWEEKDGLPVYRRAEGRQKGSPVYAFTSEIDAWLRKNPPSQAEKDPEPTPAEISGRKMGRVFWAAMGLLVLMTVGMVTWRISFRQHPVLPLRVVPLTTYPGVERHPAFSPDGKQVVFSWNGPNQDNYDLYVKFLDGGEPLPLTTHPGVDGWPMWSPDGRFIAFVRWVLGAPTAELLTVPALGGAERKIGEIPIPFKAASYWPAGCWTPDNKWLIVPTATEALGLVSLETKEVRRLTAPAAGSAGDCCPAMTTDGRNIAFLRASAGGIWNLYIQQLDPNYRPVGQPRQLTSEDAGVANPMWTHNDREVLYISGREGERMLWRIPYDGSRAATPVESLGSIGFNWAISPGGNRLVYSDNEINWDIWRIDLAGGKGINRVLSSSAQDINPQISPDGKMVAFVSGREKGWRLWISEPDGAHPIDLAPINGLRPSPGRWSPDGKQIVFECQDQGNDDICIVPSGGGEVRRLTRNPARDSLPSWSHDGKWIYITSNRSGSFQIWKVPSDGTEAGAVQLTKGGGLAAVESTNGGTVYYSREQMASGIWKVAAGGGEEIQVGSFRVFQCHTFAVSSEGIYYTSSDAPERWLDLWLYRFTSGKSERISRINKRPWSGMSVSPDNRWLLFTASEGGSADLRIVENFR